MRLMLHRKVLSQKPKNQESKKEVGGEKGMGLI